MQKLHLVGTTTDQNGLILSARRGARSGGYTLVLDEALAAAVEELRLRQEEEAAEQGAAPNRVESRLPIGEIQTRLRRGRSLKDVARDAGVEPEWVERFAAPVFAEQAEVIHRVQATFFKRARLGPSGLRIGDAVRRNLAERGVAMSPAEYNDAWRTLQRPDGRWIVSFGYHYRGANKTLKFEVRPNGDIIAADAASAQIAYVAPPKRPAVRPRPAPAPADDSAKRAVVSTGFRPEPVVKAVSRPGKEREKAAAAMNKAAAKRAIEAERAAARKARERDQLLARRAREEAAAAIQREKETAAKAREAAAAARLAAAEQAERAKAQQAKADARQAERDAARRAARLKVKADAKAVVAKKSAAAKSAKAATSDAAAAARAKPAPAKAAPKPTARPRPSAAERVDAPPPPRRAAATRPTTRTAAKRPAPAAERPAPNPRPRTAPRPRPEPEPVVEPERRPSLGEAAAEVYGEPSRAQFRAGLAAPAGDGPDTAALPAVDAPTPSANGATPRVRPPGLRRRRQLRAN